LNVLKGQKVRSEYPLRESFLIKGNAAPGKGSCSNTKLCKGEGKTQLCPCCRSYRASCILGAYPPPKDMFEGVKIIEAFFYNICHSLYKYYKKKKSLSFAAAPVLFQKV